MTVKECRFCLPETEEIFRLDERFTDAELVNVREGIWALGRALGCADFKTVCVPLRTVQAKIIRRRDNGRKTD